MNGFVLPPNPFKEKPLLTNFTHNPSLVQFNHRTMAYLTCSISFYLMYAIVKAKMHTPASYAGVLVFMLINYQALSGIITLLKLVPREKASMHQATAIVTLTSVMLMIYLARVPKSMTLAKKILDSGGKL
jgi:cytochrome c oxidase assembly protein subunit 15